MARLIGFWVVSIAIAALLASVLTAQIVPGGAFTRTPPRVVSGNDIGFRIEGTDRQGHPVGTLVVQVNGQWVEVSRAPVSSPATSH